MLLPPRKALSKAYLKVKPNRSGIEAFKRELIQVLDSINEHESEEHHKNLLSRLLSKVWYEPGHYINTKGRSDLVIHNGATAKSSVGVIIEAKRPGKGTEMLRTGNLNTKAFHELLLYYLRERITHHNLELKHLVATNSYEWFIFDAQLFEKLFTQDKALVKQFQDFEEGRLGGKNTDFFYKEIAAPVIAANTAEIAFAHFDIRDYEKPLRNDSRSDDTRLIALYKLLSPQHLLKLPFANDSNTLDRGFYSELLHIIGLTETKEGGKKLIGRPKPEQRQPGSLLENTITQLDYHDKISRLSNPRQYGDNSQERLYTVALELVITWVNRILFLKLLEAQLISYHRHEPDTAHQFAFLNSGKIRNFDDLDSLFFGVLAKKPEDRQPEINQLFGRVPYLNSSLFEPTDLEHEALFIGNLRDERTLQVPTNTVLRDNTGRKLSGSLSTLHYFFEFLNAYDFSSEGSEEIQEENKTLINASVLGLIFEKINGYKDGSFFTPGFITMYMCRETIQRALVQKFNEHNPDWNCESFAELCNRTGRLLKPEQILEANKVVNSLRICDPAVGSGHFLVSALNELIACKYQLGLLADRTGKLLNGYEVTVENDELTITNVRGGEPELFAYNPRSTESQRVQETLFHEKQTIIEQCLFGVDINSNSVKICRLRLWIELLKNAYYKSAAGTAVSSSPAERGPGAEVLETLPNIDINIKTGNSLISRFALNADLKQALKKSKYSIESYRTAVQAYHHAADKEQKRELDRLIRDIKSDFRTEIGKDDPKLKRQQRIAEELYLKYGGGLFTEKLSKAQRKDRDKLQAEAEKLRTQIEEIKSNRLYENAFEWRFEFPEVLNEDGDFVGFDVVIGNPPYFQLANSDGIDKLLKDNLIERYGSSMGRLNTFGFFVILGIDILKESGTLDYIIPNTILMQDYYENLREQILNKTKIIEIALFDNLPFKEAVVENVIIRLEKSFQNKDQIVRAVKVSNSLEFNLENKINQISFVQQRSKSFNLNIKIEDQIIIGKLNQNAIPLGDFTEINQAIALKDSREKWVKYDNEDKKLKPVLIGGKNINRYSLEWDGAFLDYTPQAIHSCNREDIFLKEKILFRRVSNSLIATLDKEHFFALHTLVVITNKADSPWLLNYILSLFNSRLMTYYFNKVFGSTKTVFTEIGARQVRLLPIKNIDEENQQPFALLVTQILDIKKADPKADTSKLEAEIDRLVYAIYGLTEEEIGLIEGHKVVVA